MAFNAQVDASIPLQVRVPPPLNLQDSYLNALRVRSAVQDQQMQPGRWQQQQLQNQSASLENQRQAYALDQQQRETAAFQKAFMPQSGATVTPAGQPTASPAPASTAATPAAPTPVPLPMGPATPPDLATVGTPSPYDSPKEGDMDGPAPPAAAPATPGAAPAQPAATTPAAAATPTAAAGDPWQNYFSEMQAAGVHPATILARRQAYVQMQTQYSNLTKDQQQDEQNKINAYGAQAKALLAMPDDASRQQYYQTVAKPALLASGYTAQQVDAQGNVTAGDLPASLPTGDGGTQYLWSHLQSSNALKGVQNSVSTYQALAAKSLGSAANQQDWDQRMSSLKAEVPPFVLSQFGPWSDDAPKNARTMGLSSQQQLQAPGTQATADQKVKTYWAGALQGVQTSDDYSTILGRMRASGAGDLADQVEAQVPQDEFDPSKSPRILQYWGLTPVQASSSNARAANTGVRQQAVDNTAAWRSSQGAFQQARLNFQQTQATDKAIKGPQGLNAGQVQTAERDIFNKEQGTAQNPGFATQLDRIDNVLGNGKNPDGTPLTPQQKADWQARRNGAAMGLQQLQFRKADLYGIQKPDPSTIAVTGEGDTVNQPDGSTWKKQNGILLYQGKAAAPAPPPPGTPAKGSPIRVKLSDGRTGTIDPADFDPASMTKIP